MRDAPEWFQEELTRIGGVNPYGEPIFRLSWSRNERMVIGGTWANGFEGYKEVRAVGGDCWALMVWEPRELHGTYDFWISDWSQGEYLACGGYPKYGRYRLMKRFQHREIQHKEVTEPVWVNGVLKFQRVRKPEFVTYRMEPCGLMLDLMLPMLIRWRRLSDEKKREAIKDEELRRNEEVSKKAKDIRDGNRVRRITPYIQKRAELIEKGMMQAMKIAAQTGLGMRVG